MERAQVLEGEGRYPGLISRDLGMRSTTPRRRQGWESVGSLSRKWQCPLIRRVSPEVRTTQLLGDRGQFGLGIHPSQHTTASRIGTMNQGMQDDGVS